MSTAPTRPAHPPLTSLDTVARALGLAASHPGVEVRGMTLDSRRVQPGDLYAALPGSLERNAHGRERRRAIAAGTGISMRSRAVE